MNLKLEIVLVDAQRSFPPFDHEVWESEQEWEEAYKKLEGMAFFNLKTVVNSMTFGLKSHYFVEKEDHAPHMVKFLKQWLTYLENGLEKRRHEPESMEV